MSQSQVFDRRSYERELRVRSTSSNRARSEERGQPTQGGGPSYQQTDWG